MSDNKNEKLKELRLSAMELQRLKAELKNIHEAGLDASVIGQYEACVNDLMIHNTELLTEAYKAINALPVKCRMLLQLRYFDCLSWEEVAERMQFSIQYCYYLHSKALGQLDSIA